MSRSRTVAALSGLLAMIAAVAISVPAEATTSTVWGLNFEDSTTGAWTQSGGGGGTLGYVDVDGSKALSVARTANYVGIQSPTGVLEAGKTYTVSAKVKLAEGTDGTTSVRFVMKPAYTWVGNTSNVSASGWTTVTGEYTVAPDADTSTLQLYIGTDDLSGGASAYTYLVDDLTVTTEAPDACTPTTKTLTGADFEDSTTGDWTQSGGGAGTLGYVDADTKALSVARTANYVGIQSPVGIFTAGTTYTVSAKVKLAEGTDGTTSVRFVMKPAYTWVGNTGGITASGWTTVTGEYTVAPDADTSTLQLYIGTDDLSGGASAYTYLVDDLTVTYQEACADGPAPGTVAINTDFESGLDGWGPRDNGTGAPTVAVTTDDSHGGTHAGLMSERTSQGSGLRHEVDGLLVSGTTYQLTAWVKFGANPVDDVWLSLENHSGGSTSYSTLAQFTGVTSGGWTQVSAQFTMPPSDEAYLYFETKYSGTNTSPILFDDIKVEVPVPPVVQDLTPIKSTVPFHMGVAIDNRETLGSPSELVAKHFNQITPENYMKPEAWYDADGNFDPNSAQIDPLMDFAKANDMAIYGHVLVWHSQTPGWFFDKSPTDLTPLTSSEEDKQILRDRLATHIHNVAQYLAQWGDFGAGNPIQAFDVVNEVVNDGASPETNGLRDSRWYQVLGEEFIADAFRDADAEFNGEFAAPGADRPVKLFINDYNTEQSGKRARYLALIDRLLAAGVPVDGIGHQFHVSLATPVSALDDALTAASGRTAASGDPMVQAVTEFDVPTGTPESHAKFIDQGYYFRDAFEVFRSHTDLFSVTVWGLNDARSWRDSSGGPLIFDDGFQAKPAYFGIVEPSGLEDPLPARVRTANSFEGSVPATAEGVAAGEWKLLPLLPAGAHASFQTRWEGDHLSVYVDVDDTTVADADSVTVTVGDTDYTLHRAGGELGAVVERTGGYTAVLHIPLTDAAAGDALQFDVRTSDNGTTTGWNDAGALGTVTLVEPISHVNVPEAAVAPVIDGTLDPVWSTSNEVQTVKQVSGSNGAIGTFHLLWKGQTLYVYAQVADPHVDTTASDPWEKDSVEIYVDGGNAKNGSYRYDDTQIRINADNQLSFGSGDEAFQLGRVQSSTAHVDGGYVVEAAISLLEYGGLDSIQGLDVQVNDATGGARTSIRNWADPTGAGYQTTARWGVATLVEGTLIDQTAFVPAIGGSAIVGSTLSATGLPTGTTLSYQWLRNGSAISGATNATYKLVTADAGAKISVRVTSVLEAYNDLTVTSAATSAVLKTFSKVTAPTISGIATVGHTLTAKVSGWSPSASFHYQWYSDGKAIPGKTGATLKLTRYQAGTTVTVKVTGSLSGYLSVAKMSAGKNVPLLTLHVGTSHLHGPTNVGGTLTITPGASLPVATVKTYQWYANGQVVPGATASTYKLKSGDLGKRMTAKVTYKATGYAPEVVFVGPTFRISAAR